MPDAAEEREHGSTRRRWLLGDEEDWEEKNQEGKRGSCPPSEGASKGNFTKADPLVMNVI